MEKKCEQFLIPDGCGGWKRPNEKNQKASYSNGTVNADHIEQRYEQLEQVARDLYSEAKSIKIALDVTNGATQTEACVRTDYYLCRYRYKLEALGVDV